ncbi:endonuclease domain-containing protein [Specibacter cremeus]|uniref:endonuclease domain-containing protein n=1 Tax=Specibacter cremeus TaxID=1629051 RepID=UPI000F791F09|nr:DUF559 domain-containing protein [Specibacter cremeus]
MSTLTAWAMDMVIEGFLVVELDGLAYHLDAKTFRKDRRRDNAAVEAGYLVLRYLYDDVVHHPERMVAQVLAVVRDRNPRHF